MFVMSAFLFDSPVYSIKNGKIENARSCLMLYHFPKEAAELRLLEIQAEIIPKNEFVNSTYHKREISKKVFKNNGIMQLIKFS